MYHHAETCAFFRIKSPQFLAGQRTLNPHRSKFNHKARGLVMSELTLYNQTTAVSPSDADRVCFYLESARARNTVRGYRSSFNQFRAWCEANELAALPAAPETIAVYLGAQAGRLKAATLEHRLSAIAKAHKAAGYESPIRGNVLISETLKGIKRTHGSAVARKAPILTDDLRLMLRSIYTEQTARHP